MRCKHIHPCFKKKSRKGVMNTGHIVSMRATQRHSPLTQAPGQCLLLRVRVSFQCRQNERDGVSNHQTHDCSLSWLFRRKSKETSKLRVTGLCEGNSPVTFSTWRRRYDVEWPMYIQHDVSQATQTFSEIRKTGQTIKSGWFFTVAYAKGYPIHLTKRQQARK